MNSVLFFFRKFMISATCFFAMIMMLSLCNSALADNDNNDKFVLALKNGDIEIELRSDLAPVHVEQIKRLVRDRSYNNVVFHRVIEGFMAQTGDVQYGNLKKEYNPALIGSGRSKYKNLRAEFSSEPFRRGTVGMARSSDPDSANSQFFICLGDAGFLNGQYTVIGKVVKGMEVVDTIKKGSTNDNGKVIDPDYILKASLIRTSP